MAAESKLLPTERSGPYRSRNLFLTIYNYTGEEAEILRNWKQVTYFVIGVEKCPKTGNWHLQCYIEFKNEVLRTTFQNKIDNKCFAEARRGTAAQASTYCKKDGDFQEYGTISMPPGTRTDKEVLRDKVRSGDSMADIANTEYCGYQHMRSAEIMMKYLEPQRSMEPIEVILCVGPDAIDKAYHDHETIADFADLADGACLPEIYEPLNLNCWDGYDAHATCLLRMHDIDSIKDARSYEKYLDRYPFRLNNKGGNRQARYTRLYILADEPSIDYNHYWEGRLLKTISLQRFVTKIL